MVFQSLNVNERRFVLLESGTTIIFILTIGQPVFQ